MTGAVIVPHLWNVGSFMVCMEMLELFVNFHSRTSTGV